MARAVIRLTSLRFARIRLTPRVKLIMFVLGKFRAADDERDIDRRDVAMPTKNMLRKLARSFVYGPSDVIFTCQFILHSTSLY